MSNYRNYPHQLIKMLERHTGASVTIIVTDAGYDIKFRVKLPDGERLGYSHVYDYEFWESTDNVEFEHLAEFARVSINKEVMRWKERNASQEATMRVCKPDIELFTQGFKKND